MKTRAAEILGISLKTLYNRLVEYGEDANKAAVGEASELGDTSANACTVAQSADEKQRPRIELRGRFSLAVRPHQRR